MQTHCPKVCGLCCLDTPGYKIQLRREGIDKECKWLKHNVARQERYCDISSNGHLVNEMCPESCDKCPSYVVTSPTSWIKPTKMPKGKGNKDTLSPTSSSPAPSINCEEDERVFNSTSRRVICNKGGKGKSPSKSTKGGKGAKPSSKPTKKPKGKGSKDTVSPTSSSLNPSTKPSLSSRPSPSLSAGPTQNPSSKPTKKPKGKGNKDTLSPTSSSLNPSTKPSTPSIIVVAFSLDICWPGCGNFSEGENAGIVLDNIAKYALDDIDPDRVDVTFDYESAECSPCAFEPQDQRFLQGGSDTSLFKSQIVVAITIESRGLVDSVNVIDKLNQGGLAAVNQDLEDAGDSFRLGDVVIQATRQPTSAPIVTSSPSERPTIINAPSPPPQELSTKSIAEQMDRFYNAAQYLVQMQDRTKLRERLEKRFSKPNDVEDMLTTTLDQPEVHRRLGSRRQSGVDNEDLFDELPDFVTLDIEDPFQCKCVDCEEDKACGGLWKGKRYSGGDDIKLKEIHVVVSHCKSDLDWISTFTKGFNIATIHIISKCGAPVNGAPDMATIEVLPNIGRCDHSYAYYITTVLDQKMTEVETDESIVFFLKDDISVGNLHQSGGWNDFETMLQLASSENGFACGISPDYTDFGPNRFFLSAYHEVDTLFEFSMEDYSRNIKGYATDGVEFQSEHNNLGSWFHSLGAGMLPEVVQVCYGGVFAVSTSNINNRDMSVWKAVENSLSRGNNIQEGHFAERSWANLMSTPLQPYQIEALVDRSDGVYLNKSSTHGALLKRPRLYLHIGAAGTSSSEILTESLIEEIDLLRNDGYNVAVHGKYSAGVNGFPNIDRLASCMWSDIDRSKFPEHMKEAALCPENVLTELTAYMKYSEESSQNVIISNPWLIHPGTAESLGGYIDPAWDVQVAIYYRRYFEWITILFDRWRQELLEHSLTPHRIPFTSFRYIDFLREYCKRLFYGKDVNEDGFPVRNLGQGTSHGGKIDSQGSVHFSQFDPMTNHQVEELTDLNEYTYFAAKQYYAHPRFRRGVKIVNYHERRDIETNFYCHVLHDAHNTCKASFKREEAMPGKPLDNDFLQLDSSVPFNTTHALEEVAIVAYKAGVLHVDGDLTQKRFSMQIILWTKMIQSALQNKDVPISSFPIECLYDFEVHRLLEVSLAYEKTLLPEFSASSRGATELEAEFAKWRFCSVNAASMLESPQWDFLFEAASDYSVPEEPKAYIHVGAPKTGTTSIQDTMAMDKKVLEEDKFFLALHGQIRETLDQDYVIENMLVECDKLGACLWSDEERDRVKAGNEHAGVCPDYLPQAFDRFLSKALVAKSNIVISNEWLSRPTSEVGLLNILDGWDPTIVIYYRRFFDWMISAHYQWHFDIGIGTMESLQGRVRLIDFIRTFCGRLFSSKFSHSPHDSHFNYAELTDIQEYTYHIWKRYKDVPSFRDSIKIVNFHDGHVIKAFYCDVLSAERACKLETERLKSGGSINTRSKSSTVYADLAIGVHWMDKNILGEDGKGPFDTLTMNTFSEVGEKFRKRMEAKGFLEDDLPKECLTEEELTLLLDVSLAYENILLPDSYATGGRDATKEHFAKTLAAAKFCSVDTKAVLADPKWKFLFEWSGEEEAAAE